MRREKVKMHSAIQEFRHILLTKWDPVGVNGVAEAEDEYDDYIPRLLSAVRANVDASDVSRMLLEIETQDMGLAPAPERAEAAAQALIKLARKTR